MEIDWKGKKLSSEFSHPLFIVIPTAVPIDVERIIRKMDKNKMVNKALNL